MGTPDVQRVLVVGAGTMGPEIAVQCAVHGVDATLYDINPAQLTRAAARFAEILEHHAATGTIDRADLDTALQRITTTSDASAAAEDVDLVSESVTEDLKVKRQVLIEFSRLCADHTILTSNSSYLLPSMMARAMERPEQFASVHFHTPVWYANVMDIMPHRRTSPETVETLRRFGHRIGQIPIVSLKENPGYVFNSMLRHFLMSAVTLAENGVASVEDIDRSWMGVTKMPIGPFGIIDNIGLDTIRDIVNFWSERLKDEQAKRNGAYLQAVIDEGRLGAKNGLGFYTYPEPAFAEPGFLTGGDLPERTVTDAGSSSPLSATPPDQEPVTSTHATTVADRLVLRASASPADDASPLRFCGDVFVLGAGPVADALRTRLAEAGAAVISPPDTCDAETVLSFLDDTLLRRAVPHLFITTPLEAEAATAFDPSRWQPRYQQGLMLPYQVAQRWFARLVETGTLNGATLVVATALGGDFGATAQVESCEGGGLAGMAKSVFMEGVAHGAAGPDVKVVDFTGEEPPAAIAEAVCREFATLTVNDPDPAQLAEQVLSRFANIEVGYPPAGRVAARVLHKPLPAGGVPAISPGGVWVLTGGARGITAQVARELGNRFGLKLHLLGTTPLPTTDYGQLSDEQIATLRSETMKQAYAAGEKPNVAWERIAKAVEVQRTLAEFRAAGVYTVYHSCDVGSREAVAAVLDVVRRTDGPISGIVHGAGYEVTGRFDLKQPEVVERTLSPKYNGTMALMELSRSDPLEYFVVFSSVAGRFGGVGQTDYAMANDLVGKQVSWFRRQRPECKSVAIYWPGWEGAGMSARPESRHMLGRISHSFISPAEGIAHLLAELAADAPEPEVLIVSAAEVPHLLKAAEGAKRLRTRR